MQAKCWSINRLGKGTKEKLWTIRWTRKANRAACREKFFNAINVGGDGDDDDDDYNDDFLLSIVKIIFLEYSVRSVKSAGQLRQLR